MIMKNSLIYTALLLSASFFACDSDPLPAEIPPAIFDDIFINLDLPEYQPLDIQGFVYVQAGGGSNGIILYKNSVADYNAYERTCSYDPFNATAIIEVTPGNTAMVDYTCGSYFTLENGQPQGGPAFVPLRQYRVILNGRSLTITDEPVN